MKNRKESERLKNRNRDKDKSFSLNFQKKNNSITLLKTFIGLLS